MLLSSSMNRFKIIIFAFITLFALSSYFIYSKYFSRVKSRDLILSEDREEYKKRPVDRGGIVIPNSNSLIYEKLNHRDGKGADAEINLQPETEEPLNLDFKNDVEQVEKYDSIDDILAKLDLSQEDENIQIDSGVAGDERVSSLVSSADGSDLKSFKKKDNERENVSGSSELVISPSSEVVAEDLDGGVTQQKASNLVSNDQEAGAESAITDVAMPEIVLTEQESVNEEVVSSVGGDAEPIINGLKIIQIDDQNNKLQKLNMHSDKDFGYKLHLSSAWSEKEAKNEWQKIKARHAKYLDKTELTIKKVTASNGKIIYLVMAGNYSSLDKAKLICKKLHLSNQNCIVTK